MLLNVWLDELKNFLKSGLFDSSKTNEAKLFFVRLHELMLAAPAEIRNPFGLLDEPDIDAEMMHWVQLFSRGPVRLPVQISQMPQDEQARVLAGVVRACDQLVADFRRGPATRSREWDFGDWWVIDRKKGRLKGNQGEPYTRRGLRRHVLLKKVVQGLHVRPQPLVMQIPQTSSTRLGAALFEGLEVTPDPLRYPKYFLAVDVKCADQGKVVDAQMASARKEKHLALVWPELTIPPKIRDRIEANLRGTAFGAPDTNPELTVAGTWHEPDDGLPQPVSNVAVVYDKYGREALRYKKVVPYHDRGKSIEPINIGNELPVLVSDEFLVTFAICKDLCDLASNVAYREMNVDFVLVPSMGDETCMQSHRVNAKGMRTQRNARPFVVQQTVPDDGSGLGKVLPPVPDPTSADLDLNVAVTFKSYDGHL
uniref:hypothetical protein n=1 Tax=Ensifer adhaerens TaxID=106592 RepID=UPI003F4937DA